MHERSFSPGMGIGAGVNLRTGQALAAAFEPPSLIVRAMRPASVMSRSARPEPATGYQSCAVTSDKTSVAVAD